jgi:beta-xylosidase
LGATGGQAGTGGSGGSSGQDAAVDAYVWLDANRSNDGAVDAPAGDAASIPGTNNPVLVGYNADPNVVVFDNTFYIFPTTDGFANWAATSFSVFSSTNLVQWSNRGVILNLAKDLTWATSYGWAPSIARVGGTYYFYFSADSQLGVATSSSLTGPFKDALGKPLATTRQYGPQSIDPYVFIDDDGTPYLYFGSGAGGLRLAKLNANMISFAGTPANISPSGASGTLEGSVMFKRKGTYYLAWSEGDTRSATYQMAYARAQSPQGPFTRLAVIVQQDTALGILGPGGGTVLAIPSRDEYYLVYHRFKIPGGDGTHRETCIDKMSFNSDGTIVPVKPTLQGLQAAVLP